MRECEHPISVLRRIGIELHAGNPPRAYERGRLHSGSGSPVAPTEPAEGGHHAHTSWKGARPETGSRQGAARRRATAHPARTGNPRPSVLRELTAQHVERREDLAGAMREYKQLRLSFAPAWPFDPALWLSGWVEPIAGLDDAFLLIRYPSMAPSWPVSAWAWWRNGIRIGPRHTNYGDGSICSYEPGDTAGASWARGMPLLRLLDFHSLWIARHLHLAMFRWWPGKQVLHTPHERLAEQQALELCGGCASGRQYDGCCRPKDELIPPAERVAEYRRRMQPRQFSRHAPGGRQIPPAVLAVRNGLLSYDRA
jgi:hypothetical protein